MAFVQARVNAAIDAAKASVTHAQLHTGAPGGRRRRYGLHDRLQQRSDDP